MVRPTTQTIARLNYMPEESKKAKRSREREREGREREKEGG